MSSEKSGFDSLKSGFFRLKQKAMVVFGRAEETVDLQFDAEKLRFDLSYKSLRSLLDGVRSYQRAIKDLQVARTTVADRLQACYSTSSPLWPAVLAQQHSCNDGEQRRLAQESQLQAAFFDPFAHYLEQYKTLQGRIELRGKRRTDMDRYRHEVKLLVDAQASPSASAATLATVTAKLAVAREKADRMTHAYQQLNAEIICDIARLLDDRQAFLDPLFAALVDSQHDYHAHSAASLFHQLLPQLAFVAPRGQAVAARNHPAVITPTEQSALTVLHVLPHPESRVHSPPPTAHQPHYQQTDARATGYDSPYPSGAHHDLHLHDSHLHESQHHDSHLHDSHRHDHSGEASFVHNSSLSPSHSTPDLNLSPASHSELNADLNSTSMSIVHSEPNDLEPKPTPASSPWEQPGSSSDQAPLGEPPIVPQPLPAPQDASPHEHSSPVAPLDPTQTELNQPPLPPPDNHPGDLTMTVIPLTEGETKEPPGEPSAVSAVEPVRHDLSSASSAPKLQLARALYDFVPQAHNELGFRSGEVLLIRQFHGDWLVAELDGKRGLIPTAYVQIF